jgi:type I restriction enzyme S subunit
MQRLRRACEELALPTSWPLAPLDELLDEVLDRRGITPLKLGSYFKPAGHRVISAKVIKRGRLDLLADEPRFVDPETYLKWMKTPLAPGDVLLTSEAPLGAVAYVTEAHDWCLGQRLFALRSKKGLLKGRFLYYALQSPEVSNDIQSRATGTTAQGIRQGELRKVRIPVPPLRIQEAIADTLGALDDKTELNRRMNEQLVSISQALFKSWLVNFDPVHSKANSRDVRLPKHLADLFPDSFENSELGKIPRGWTVRGLDEIACFRNGLPLQKYPSGEGGSLPVIKIAQLRSGNADGDEVASANLAPEYIVEDGDVLFSWSGTLECVIWAGGRGAVNQHLFKVSSAGYPKWLYYLWIHQHLNTFRHIAAGKATTMGHIQRHHLSEARVVLPPLPLLQALDVIMSPLIEGLWRRRVQSRILAALRDMLLPRLISGELRIQDTKRIIGRYA